MKIKKEKMLDMAAVIISGMMSNPANANLAVDQYNQQQLFMNVLNTVQQALISAGFEIED